jgi:outer membrane protein assembly factor BamA
MPRRPATVTQADIARAIRALRDAGAPVERVRVRLENGGVVVEVAEPARGMVEIGPGGEHRIVRL